MLVDLIVLREDPGFDMPMSLFNQEVNVRKPRQIYATNFISSDSVIRFIMQ